MMSFSVKPHLPLISKRVEFTVNKLPSPPSITLRQDLEKHVKRQIRRAKTPYNRMNTKESPNELRDSSPESNLKSPSPLSTDSELEDDMSEEEHTSDSKRKILKPPGEAGRSNSGGFNLEKALGWEEEKYNNLTVRPQTNVRIGLTSGQKYLNDLVGKKLDVQKSFSSQKPEIVKDVIQIVSRLLRLLKKEVLKSCQVNRKFKIEGVYDKDWPVREALKLRLKYTSEAARKQHLRKTDKTLKKVSENV